MTQPAVSFTAQKGYDRVAPLAYADEANGWALLYLCVAIAAMFDDTADLFRDGDDGRPGWTKLGDPDLCPDRWVDWSATNIFGVDFEPGLTVAQKRIKWKEAPGTKLGRPGAVNGAVKPYLTGADPTVILTERIGGDYRVYAVATLLAETPDQDAVYAALLREKPGGWRFTYTAITGGDYDTLAATHADYAELATDFADYAAMAADPSHT